MTATARHAKAIELELRRITGFRREPEKYVDPDEYALDATIISVEDGVCKVSCKTPRGVEVVTVDVSIPDNDAIDRSEAENIVATRLRRAIAAARR